jgi:hypothetical protein
VVIEIKKNLLGIKRLNKKKKLKQLAFCRMKLLKNGSPKDGVKSICDVRL